MQGKAQSEIARTRTEMGWSSR